MKTVFSNPPKSPFDKGGFEMVISILKAPSIVGPIFNGYFYLLQFLQKFG